MSISDTTLNGIFINLKPWNVIVNEETPYTQQNVTSSVLKITYFIFSPGVVGFIHTNLNTSIAVDEYFYSVYFPLGTKIFNFY